MKKALIILLSVCCLFSMLMFAACGDAKIAEFNVDETTKHVSVGESYSIPKVSAKDSKGKYIIPVLTVTDPEGNEVTVDNFTFTPAKIGEYTVKYTVTSGKNTEEKSYKLDVFDLTEPEVELDLKWYNITVLGTTFDTKTITVTDNSGETITPEVTVLFNDTAVETTDGVVTFDQKGTYKIHVKAEDSSENVNERDYVVWTAVDYEDGVCVENQYYPNQVTDKQAHGGEKSMEVRLFSNAPSWFNDESMLGEIYFYGDTTENPFTHVSYWIYFDFDAVEETGTASVNGMWYDFRVFDIYGAEVEKNWQSKYEFKKNTWYRVVVDLTEWLGTGDPNKPLPIKVTEDGNLMHYGIFFGLWGSVNGGNDYKKEIKVYIDDIRIVDPENDDEVYAEAPAPEEEKYEKGERLNFTKFGDLVWKLGDSNGEDVTLKAEDNTELVKYNFYHGTIENPKKFDAYANQLVGTDTSASEAADKRAWANGWQVYTGNNDGFIYSVTALKTVFVDIKTQVKDVDEAADNMGGWLDSGSSCTLRVYIKDASGKLKEVYSYAPNGASGVDESGKPTGYEVTGVLVEEGCTLYYEYKFEWTDSRNINNPPYLCIYTANEKQIPTE